MIDVKHIAKLARLGITEEEEKKFEKDLSAILEFVAKLNEVNTEGVEPTAQVTGTTNVLREDEINQLSQSESVKEGILKNAPQKEKGYFKVKRILE
ncbi:MAG: asparaginyl/glutamyl-tRNA amidotransferase subunit C [Candidatus Portnoybacteria bacterium RBG_13_41_18]|uniref:Aspartyl/glutamyl-tRNA(Asn/Gln) amidotransferase subunit C n=1 Tax=Candidatus Portnoybacteria bacterium RBG_13_41_18 TaxID=1801991 RepID=A0A1G2F751_9BACT|nr:MAG: asparaginyl/glutamyl-tRNA amidotransferase subunit C [Candidatus Portnoybacteria bacterium RBG_13_41_18]